MWRAYTRCKNGKTSWAAWEWSPGVSLRSPSPGVSLEKSLYLVHFNHNCVHITMRHRLMLTTALCSRFAINSRLTVARVGTYLFLLALALVSWSSAGMEALQEKLGELAARNGELAQRLGAVEASASSTPNPQQVLVPSAIDTRLLKQPVAFDRERSAPIGRLRSGPVPVQSAGARSFWWNTRTARRSRWHCPQPQVTSRLKRSCTTC